MKSVESMRKIDKSFLRNTTNGASYKSTEIFLKILKFLKFFRNFQENPELINSLLRSKPSDLETNAEKEEENEVFREEGSNQDKKRLEDIFENRQRSTELGQSQLKISNRAASHEKKSTPQFLRKNQEAENAILIKFFHKTNFP